MNLTTPATLITKQTCQTYSSEEKDTKVKDEMQDTRIMINGLRNYGIYKIERNLSAHLYFPKLVEFTLHRC